MEGGITIEIGLFGAFRQFDTGAPYLLELPKDANVAQLKQAFLRELKHRFPDFDHEKLLAQSALATEQEVLDENAVFEQDTKLVILPPVSGG